MNKKEETREEQLFGIDKPVNIFRDTEDRKMVKRENTSARLLFADD